MSKLFLQDSPNGRGPACLATILNHHGLFITPLDLAQVMPSSRAGVSKADLIATAAKFGLQGESLDSDAASLGALPKPLLAYAFGEPGEERAQPVVVFAVRGNRVWVGDPSRGTAKTTVDRFAGSYSGQVVLFRPDASFQPAILSETYLALFLKFLKGFRTKILLVLLLGLAVSASGFGLIYCSKLFVDAVLPRQEPGALLVFAGVYFLAKLLHIAVRGLNQLFTVAIRNGVSKILAERYFWHLTGLELRHFDSREKGEFLEQFNQIESLTDGVANYFASFVLVVLGIGLKMSILFALYDWVLVTVLVSILALNALLGFLFAKATAEKANRQGLVRGMLNTSIIEGIADIRVVRLFGARQWIRQQFGRLQRESLSLLRRLTALNVYGRSLADVLNILSEAAIFVICGLRILEGNYSLGDFLLFFAFAQGLAAESLQFPELILSFPVQLRAFARVQGVLSLSLESGGSRTLDAGSFEISFKNVTFSYERGKPVLEDVSLVLEAGKTTAFVGESGSGKTTVMNLIMGFYRPDSGVITVNGTELADLDRESYRSCISAVLQDTPLLAKTLYQNVALGNPAVTPELVKHTARTLGIDDFIESLPMRYDQLLYTGAVSGGQTQLVGILRAMCKPFSLLLMDEATSHLDSRTERRVLEGIESLNREPKTRAIIAHRLSTVRAADRIVVLKDGRVAETGTHQSLVRKKGSYLELIQRQYEVDLAPPPPAP